MGYEVVWSDMDSVWLQNFFEVMPRGLDYVGIDDSLEENEQVRPCAHTNCSKLSRSIVSTLV
jgi:hypothetical protein